MLDQMVAQLEMLSRYVAGHDLEEDERKASNDTLNTQISGEMHALGSAVDSGNDLATLRKHLRTRMDSIGRHLQDFKGRELERSRQTASARTRCAGEWRNSKEARKLHASLAESACPCSMPNPDTQPPGVRAAS
jgi:hypothetical protein